MMTVWMPFQFGVCGRERDAATAVSRSGAHGNLCLNSSVWRTSKRGELPPPARVHSWLPCGPVIHLTHSHAASLFFESLAMPRFHTPRMPLATLAHLILSAPLVFCGSVAFAPIEAQ